MALDIRSQNLNRLRNNCFLTAVLVFCGPAAFAQTPAPAAAPPIVSQASPMSVKTELVLLPVSVTDSAGNVVLGLTQQDFQIYEDGHLQSVTMFHQRDTPVTVGLIVDHSRSMGSKLEEVAAAVSSFAHSSNPSDEMFVVDFNDDVSVELMDGKPFSNDPGELSKAVFAVHARGMTALYDAVAEGLLHLQLGHSDRKALIIVSDGGDNASKAKFAQILAQARQSQVVVYSIVLIGDTDEVNPDVLRRLSKATGGIAYVPDAANSVESISQQIANDLREQYTLGFAPDKAGNAGAFRKLEVKVSAPGHGKIRVRTRSGYFASDEKSSPAQASKGAN